MIQSVESIFNLNEFKKDITEEIICGKRLKFNYINSDYFIELLDSKGISKKNLSYLDILKYNFNEVIDQLANYFPDIKINKFENSPCISECKIKKEEFTYKFNLYLVLSKNDKIYEYCFDFFSNINDIPENKYYHSKTLLDDYQFFISEDIQSNEDIKMYLNENLFKLLTAVCALKDDEYQLAEIMFVKSNQENMTSKEILKQLGYFLRIINFKKSNEIDLEDLFDELMLVNEETKKQINKKEFTEIINNTCIKEQIIFSINQKTISFSIFEILLMNINTKYSSKTLLQFKKTYLIAMSILMDSLKIIIKLVKEINLKKTFTPDYIINLIEFHLDEYNNQNAIKQFYDKKQIK